MPMSSAFHHELSQLHWTQIAEKCLLNVWRSQDHRNKDRTKVFPDVCLQTSSGIYVVFFWFCLFLSLFVVLFCSMCSLEGELTYVYKDVSLERPVESWVVPTKTRSCVSISPIIMSRYSILRDFWTQLFYLLSRQWEWGRHWDLRTAVSQHLLSVLIK